jgi:hypothetical protein
MNEDMENDKKKTEVTRLTDSNKFTRLGRWMGRKYLSWLIDITVTGFFEFYSITITTRISGATLYGQHPNINLNTHLVDLSC